MKDVKTFLLSLLKEKEDYLLFRRSTETNELMIETSLHPEEVGGAFFAPMIVDSKDEQTFDYAVEIMKSLVNALEVMSGQTVAVSPQKNTIN